METRIFSDLDLNFTKHPITKDVSLKTKEHAVIASVRNLILTNFHERPFNPNIGSGIRGLLFEPVDALTASTLKKQINIVLENFEPRVNVDDITVLSNETEDGYNVSIKFYILNSLNPITISTFLSRLR